MKKATFIAAIIIIAAFFLFGSAVGGMEYGDASTTETVIRIVLGIIFASIGIVLGKKADCEEG